MNLPELATSDRCTGCAACFNICPKNAIKMEYNEEGFLEPNVDATLCIGCKKCQNVCPDFAIYQGNVLEPYLYACICADEELRAKSSSGGMFGILADYVLEKGGAVCGAAFTEDFYVKHKIVFNKKDLNSLYESKYVQSEIGNCFTEIKKLLEDGICVLFCGTPCQVAGLNNFLGKQYEKLITCDLLCHGAPSPKLWQKYLDETYGRKRKDIVRYSFRDKSHFGWATTENVYFKSGTSRHCDAGRNPWYQGFLPCWTTRKSCGICKSSSLPRQGDFTLGDAWGIRSIKPALFDGKGTSLITVNNAKAKKIFSEIKCDLKSCEQLPLEWILTHGQPFNRPMKNVPFQHDRLFHLMKYKSFNDALSQTKKGSFDVAIMGVWYGHNYGSILTYYSLYNFLYEQGYLVLMIEKAKPYSKEDLEFNPDFHSRKFAINHYKDRISRKRDPSRLSDLNDFADTFILGADQMLHKNQLRYLGNAALLDFTENYKKRIMYASSFGHEQDSNPPEKRDDLRKLFKRFDAISLREESGVKIMNKNYGIKNACTVIDSVFLCGRAFWEKLASESQRHEEKPYLLAYILDPSELTQNILLEIAKKKNLELVLVLDGNTPYSDRIKKERGITLAKDGVETQDFVWYFYHADFVITDSFHGTCFSIIFEKPFITKCNKMRGEARFKDILGLTGLNDRLIYNEAELPGSPLLEKPIDWNNVNKNLLPKIRFSQNWLLNALKKKKKQPKARDAKKPIFFAKTRRKIHTALSLIKEIRAISEKLDSLNRKVDLLSKKMDSFKNNDTFVPPPPPTAGRSTRP